MLSKRVTIVCLSVLSLQLMAWTGARAQALVSARVLSSEGPVEIQRRGQGQAGLTKIEYRVNDELATGDVIKTLKGGRLVLGLTDGSQAIIGEQTTVEITDLSRSPRTIFNVLRGKTRIKIEKMGGRPNPYRVNTPTAVIAVRGTLFDVLVSGKETRVLVYEGEVAVSNQASPDVQVVLPPGWSTRVRLDRPPDSPSTFRPDRHNDQFEPRPSDRRLNDDSRDERGAEGRSREPQGDRKVEGSQSPSNDRHEGQRDGDRKPPDFR
jgi:ferric-dicitrate binding protein FerR (iron transport regulator)